MKKRLRGTVRKATPEETAAIHAAQPGDQHYVAPDIWGEIRNYEIQIDRLCESWGYAGFEELKRTALAHSQDDKVYTREVALHRFAGLLAELKDELTNGSLSAEAAAHKAFIAGKHLLLLFSAIQAPAVQAGQGTSRGGGSQPKHSVEHVERELDRQHQLHSRWGITALREEAGKALDLSGKQIGRITNYDPRK